MEIKTKRLKLSAIIIAKNEEKKIGGCLKSLAGLVDEIIVVDNDSIDKTVNISKSYGAKIFEYKGGSYSDWRNEGLKKAGGVWILYVDADERVTPELRDEILELVSSIKYPVSPHSAFAIPRRNIILGKELKHGGWWPDYVKRLFRKNKFIKWVGELHEEPTFEGDLGHLKNPLIHIKHDNLYEMVEKTNSWSEIEARLMLKANHPPMTVPRFLSAMFREFWLRMVHHAAFLDGPEGIIYALYQVFSRFTSYAKLWELQIKK